MSKNGLCAVLALGLLCARAGAEEEPIADKPGDPLIPLRVQVVFARFHGETKLSSMPYTLSMDSGESAALRMGIQVPLTVRGDADQPATVMFKDVGTNLDCRARALDGGRFKLRFSLEQASLASGNWEAVSSTPVLRNFKSQSSLILRDGQTGQFIAATDPVTGEVLKIDVTLNVGK